MERTIGYMSHHENRARHGATIPVMPAPMRMEAEGFQV
jgi:hypothetical protein